MFGKGYRWVKEGRSILSRGDDVNVLMGNQFIHFTPFAMLSANEFLLCENIISFDGLREIFQLISKVGHAMIN